MTSKSKKKKKKLTPEQKEIIKKKENARLAAMLLPPPVKNAPKYTVSYLESFKHQLFQACANSRHRKCPRTSDRPKEHLFCSCACHRKDLTKNKIKQLITKQIADLKKKLLKKSTKRSGATVTGTTARRKGVTRQYFTAGPSAPHKSCSHCGKEWKHGRKTRFDDKGAYCGAGCQRKFHGSL
jgi:hypothetical protein